MGLELWTLLLDDLDPGEVLSILLLASNPRLVVMDPLNQWLLLTKLGQLLAMLSVLENIITRFGIHTSLVFDNVTYFSSLKLYEFALENDIVLKHASNY